MSKVNRREMLAGAGVLLLGLTSKGFSTVQKIPKFSSDPFSLGVASGDPLADGFVIWTRLAPDPLASGGMPPQSVAVEWQVATDDRFRRIVKRGRAAAQPGLAHSVHVDVRGLEPARWYWYQFKVGSQVSPVGRTRTAPAPGARLEKLSFAFASCQHYEDGYYTAHRHLAREDLDLIIFLGDYIYEGGVRQDRVRAHNSEEIYTLADYRNRYALYKSDPDLQQAHAAFPWVVTWDDHEVDNNYAGAIDQDNTARTSFLQRRAAAYQAYYEHMPLRRASLPQGTNMRLYRQLEYGALADFFVLDTRQYRTDQPCGDGHQERCPAALESRATLLGPAQERWLLHGLDQSSARWNVLAQQVMMSQTIEVLSENKRYQMDNWNGYVEARKRLFDFVQRRRVLNPVVLTGDIHSNWVADLKADFELAKSKIIGTEFIGTSISSGGNGVDQRPETDHLMSINPHIKFHNGQRGYVRCTLSPKLWRSDYRVVPLVTQQDAPVSTRASFIVESGRPGAERA